MADWVGTIVGLWDLAVRVATFANDIRSAQDDFVGLHAEAECLLICINSLNSPSCRDTLYKYINAEQASDLDSLVKNTELNVQDLNKFIAKCWRLVERDLRKNNVRRRGWKRLGTRLKEMVAKTWAKYWFVMADKQAFRDKLVLPAQSINIYLTSLTHIGLVNVGFLMQLSGHGEAGGCACACSGGGGGGGGAGGGGVGGGNRGGGGVIVKVNPCDGWQAVGRRLAFRDPIVKRSDLTTDLEEEIIMYALYLMRGGTPFHAKGSGGGGGSSGGGKYKVSKTTTTTKTRTRSRSRSLGPMGLGKGNNRKMYVVRKKSVSRPSTERIEIVEREYVSESDSVGHPHRRVLALPAPDSPSSASGAQFVEIKPSSRPSSSSSSDDSGNNERGPGPGRSPRPSPPTSPPGNGAGLHPDSARRERRRNDGHPNPGLPRPNPSARTSGYETSREELSARRRRVLNSIQDEGDAAVAELEAKQAASRDRRRFRRASRTADYHPTPEQERDEDNEGDILEMCNIIEEEYGVRVVPLPEGTRDPILAPMVRPAAPVPEEEVEAGIRLESRESGRRSRRSKVSRLALESSESEASDVEDEMLVKNMSRGRSDRLKAETSMLGSASGFAYGPRSYAYEDPLRRTRSAYDNPASHVRFEPYPASPYDRHREQQRHRSRYPTEFYDDHINVRPDPGYGRTINIEPQPRYGMYRRPSHPHGRDDSDDDSYYGPSRPVPKPRGPGPGPPPPAQIFVQRKEDQEQEAERMRETREKLMMENMEQHRARMYDEPRIIISNDDPSQRPPSGYDQRRTVSYSTPIISHDYEHGSASETLKRRPIDRERRSSRIIEPVDDEDVYMSGARHENDVIRRYESDDEDDHHEIHIVRDE